MTGLSWIQTKSIASRRTALVAQSCFGVMLLWLHLTRQG